MNTISSINQIDREIPQLLLDAGCTDGLINKTTTNRLIKFFKGNTLNESDTKAETYILWQVNEISVESRADDGVRSRNGYVSINIYTRLDSQSESIKLLIGKLEETAKSLKWSFEFSEHSYDKTLQINYLSFDLTKSLI